MNLEIDPDVKAIAEFMQHNIPTMKLVASANAIAAIAPLLWGHYDGESLHALQLREPSISARGLHTQSGTSELPPAA